MIFVGPVENVFHALPWIKRFERWGPELIRFVDELSEACG